MPNAIIHAIKLAMILVVGIVVSGFVGGTLASAVPEWAEYAPPLQGMGVLATILVAAFYIVRAVLRRDEPAAWNLRSFLRAPLAAVAFFLVSEAGNLLATVILAGRPALTGMVGTLETASLPALHYGAPLLGFALGLMVLVWRR